MRKFLLGIEYITSTSGLLVQAMISRTKLSFNAQSEIITKAIGWAYNDELGEWVKYRNVISSNKSYKIRDMSFLKTSASQRFLSIQFKAILLDSLTYYVLVIRRKNGVFQYPNTTSGWYSWQETFGFIFTESEYNKLYSSDGIVELKSQYLIDGYEKMHSDLKFIDLIQKNLRYNNSYLSTYTFAIKKVTVKGERLVKFLLPEKHTSVGYNDLNKKYFEVTPTEFNKLLIK